MSAALEVFSVLSVFSVVQRVEGGLSIVTP